MCIIFVLLGFLFISSTAGQLLTLAGLANAVIQNTLTPLNIVLGLLIEFKSITPPPFNDTVQFYCANPLTNGVFQEVFMFDPNISTKIDKTLPIGFLIHGWLDSSNEQYVQDVTNDWVRYRNENVCRVNWSYLSGDRYEKTATINIRFVSNYVTQFIMNLEEIAGIQPESITLVGHSLGAHICGFIGEHLNGRIKMIIGLDAAGLYFTVPVPLPTEFRLDSSDAQHVVLLHTDDGLLGINYKSGHQDFYANTGFYPQRGCIGTSVYTTYHSNPSTCAHYRSIDYFRDSLKPTSNCNALQCNNLLAYALRICTDTIIKFGLDATPGINGKFYFATTDDNPAQCSGIFW